MRNIWGIAPDECWSKPTLNIFDFLLVPYRVLAWPVGVSKTRCRVRSQLRYRYRCWKYLHWYWCVLSSISQMTQLCPWILIHRIPWSSFCWNKNNSQISSQNEHHFFTTFFKALFLSASDVWRGPAVSGKPK